MIVENKNKKLCGVTTQFLKLRGLLRDPLKGWTKETNCYSWTCRHCHSTQKVKAINDCTEKQFTPHERLVEARIQALLEAVNNNSHERTRPYDVQKLINSLKLSRAYGTGGILNKYLSHIPYCLSPWKEKKR